jgi:hypothetical protein
MPIQGHRREVSTTITSACIQHWAISRPLTMNDEPRRTLDHQRTVHLEAAKTFEVLRFKKRAALPTRGADTGSS